MDEGRSATGSLGYVVALLGAVGFVVSCFLPYFDVGVGPSQPFSISLYRSQVLGPNTAAGHVGGFLFLFAGVGTLAVLSLAGVLRLRSWAPSALAAVSVAWSLTWIGALLNDADLMPHKAAGYWSLLLSVVVVVAGSVIVWVSARSRSAAPRQRLSV